MDGCIEYPGKKARNGYGRKWLQGAWHGAHRVAFFERHGYWPQVARHTCDNPPCWNADHIVDGTLSDNQHDAVERGRTKVGASSPLAKLTDEQADEIRMWIELGHTQRRIAKAYGVGQSLIARINLGQTYRKESA